MDFSKIYFGTQRESVKHAKMCYYFYHKNRKWLHSANNVNDTSFDITPTSCASINNKTQCQKNPDKSNPEQGSLLPNLSTISNSIVVINSAGVE